MAMIELARDFKEFLQLLNSEKVEYLVVGGYAVGIHGYPRATGDLDIWVAVHPQNINQLVSVIEKFGFGGSEVSAALFQPPAVIRMGEKPVRIELLTQISGVTFDDCFARRQSVEVDGITIHVIGLSDLKANKRAAGRGKDLADSEQLEG